MATTLYRCRTPTDWLCPCGRVARELRKGGEEVVEIRVPWSKNDREQIRELSGQNRVPLVVFEDEPEPLCDSLRIVEHLRWRSGVTTR